jgi:protocatechuate 3,4-dioxygenase beta subunit
MGEEPGVEGWGITLYRWTDGEWVEYDSATTDADGYYSFSGLLPGDYKVVEESKSGWLPMTPTEVLFSIEEPGEQESADFGNWEIIWSLIHGSKFHDMDEDGVWDLSEPGLPGWTIELWSGESFVASTTTDANGYYQFDDLDLGEYTVREIQQDGWFNTTPMTVGVTVDEYAQEYGPVLFGNDRPWKSFALDVLTDVPEGTEFHVVYALNGDDQDPLALTWDGQYYSAEVELGYLDEISNVRWYAEWDGMTFLLDQTLGEILERDVENSLDFGSFIDGYKYKDYNGNGQWDLTQTEFGMEDWTIELYVWYDGGWVLYDSTTTDASGYYSFEGLFPGTYKVEEVLQDGWVQVSSPSQFEAENGSEIGGLDFGNRLRFKHFELTVENFGEMPDGVSFYVTFDAAGPGVDEPFMVPLGSAPPFEATVELPDGTELTNVQWWAFWNGEQILLGQGADREILSDDMENTFDYDAELFGYKYDDLLENGVDDDEPRLQGWTIELYRLSEPVRIDTVPDDFAGVVPSWVLYATDITDASGEYSFSGLLPGVYAVAEVQQPGWAQTGGPGAYDTDPFETTFLIGNGDAEGPIAFGNRQPVKTFDLMFTGTLPEADGFFVEYTVSTPPPEPPTDLTAEAIALFREDLEPYDAGDEKMHYRFVDDDRAAGETIGMVWWYAQYGSEELLLGVTEGELLGASDVTNPFEYESVAFGSKFDDSGSVETPDGAENGLWDPGEFGIPNWTIQLYRQAPDSSWTLYRETLTDENGAYEFENILPGTYYLAEVIPDLGPLAEWTQSAGPSAEGEGAFTITNDGEVSDTEHGPVDFGNFTRLLFQDLALLKTGDETFEAGEVVDYTITYWVTSGGPFSGPDFYIEDDFDERYIDEIVDANGGVVSDGKIRWDLNAFHPSGLAIEDGEQTLTYTVRVKPDDELPEDLTDIDNVARINHPNDSDPENNEDDHRTSRELLPFLPFTGGDALLLIALALAAGLAGVTLRRRAHAMTS